MTSMRRTRLWSLLPTLAGLILVLAGVAWAIAEGYASDIEMRSGNIVPAALVGAAGLVCLVIGLVASARGSQRLVFGILTALGAVTVGAFAVLSGIDYAQLESQGLEGLTPTWILVGMAVGAGVAVMSAIGLVGALVKRSSARRRTN